MLCRLTLLLLGSLILASCATPRNGLQYAITTQSNYLCCRTLRFSTWEFPRVEASTLEGEGVVVRLAALSPQVDCENDLALSVVIANNSDQDVYVPVSYELHGDTLLLYPFRGGWAGTETIRIARQLQYGDIVDRDVPRLQFHRLPAGGQVRLKGIVPRKWLCSQTIPANDEYLAYEARSTDFFVGRSKSLGTLPYRRDTDLRDTLRLRFDVGYARLDFYKAYPILEEALNPGRDSVSVRIAVNDVPKELLDASQQVAFSNILSLRLD